MTFERWTKENEGIYLHGFIKNIDPFVVPVNNDCCVSPLVGALSRSQSNRVSIGRHAKHRWETQTGQRCDFPLYEWVCRHHPAIKSLKGTLPTRRKILKMLPGRPSLRWLIETSESDFHLGSRVGGESKVGPSFCCLKNRHWKQDSCCRSHKYHSFFFLYSQIESKERQYGCNGHDHASVSGYKTSRAIIQVHGVARVRHGFIFWTLVLLSLFCADTLSTNKIPWMQSELARPVGQRHQEGLVLTMVLLFQILCIPKREKLQTVGVFLSNHPLPHFNSINRRWQDVIWSVLSAVKLFCLVLICFDFVLDLPRVFSNPIREMSIPQRMLPKLVPHSLADVTMSFCSIWYLSVEGLGRRRYDLERKMTSLCLYILEISSFFDEWEIILPSNVILLIFIVCLSTILFFSNPHKMETAMSFLCIIF